MPPTATGYSDRRREDMAHQRYDRTSKWLLEHPGDRVLWLGGAENITHWRALQAEVVQPRQLRDGLLEVQQAGEPSWDLYLLEISTYPDRRVADQIGDDVMLVFQDRRVLPEVLVLVLYPRGNLEVAREIELRSHAGWTQLKVNWRVVELWKLPAAKLLATRQPGLMPWVPLTQFQGPPEPIFEQCRAVIEDKAPPEEHDNLLAVSQVLASLRYNDPRLLAFFGGDEAMIESPVLQRFLAERLAENNYAILTGILEDRFGPVPASITNAVKAITDNDKLQKLARFAARCSDLEEFRRQLST